MDKRLMLVGLVILLIVVAVGWTFERPGTPAHRAAGQAASSSGAAGAASLRWRIVRSYTARRIVNAYLPPTRANGVYLIMDISTTNGSGHTIVLAPSHVSLDLAGARYQVDAAAVSALELAGHRSLSGTGLGPETTTSGWVVFDVPPAAVAAQPQVCFDEASSGRSAGDEVCRA
jgi:hypothetical protein